MSNNQDHIQGLLKSFDPERYLASLYLPQNIRQAAMVVYAFDAEISRILDLVSEPMPGEIRIQWWRDLIKSGGNAGSGPLAEELLRVISEHNLPRDVFDNYLEAKIFDLYQDPMPDLVSYEGYLGETNSALLHMLALASNVERNTVLADACGHTGVANGITRHLSICAKLKSEGRIYFPISILEENGLDRNKWLATKNANNHVSVIKAMIDLASEHLGKAFSAISQLPRDSRSIFLSVVFADALLSKISKNPSQCLNTPVSLSPLKRQWIAFRGLGKL